MTLNLSTTNDTHETLRFILDLSYRISRYSPPMKPFLRFSKQTDNLFRDKSRNERYLYWDFDDTLQMILLGIAQSVATPEELSSACTDRWKININNLYWNSKDQLQELVKNNIKPQYRYTYRDELIFSKIVPGSRFLYLGCGSGSECLRIAERGYSVFGIDTFYRLVEIGNEWAQYFKLPYYALCMDAMNLGFTNESFDGFLLEFYGNQPSLTQTLALQSSLAKLLKPEGKGFMVATRKKYASFWFMMGQMYPQPMANWLLSQSNLDFYFSKPDDCVERLLYGFFIRSHTVDSLSHELSNSFDVLDCSYDAHDPRYILGVVKRKSPSHSRSILNKRGAIDYLEYEHMQLSNVVAPDTIYKINCLCDMLESQEKRVKQFFLDNKDNTDKNPLCKVETQLLEFIHLLEEIYRVLPISKHAK